VDAGVALLVGFTVAGLILWLLSVVEPAVSWREAPLDRRGGGSSRHDRRVVRALPAWARPKIQWL
jgi:hypothetical protein